MKIHDRKLYMEAVEAVVKKGETPTVANVGEICSELSKVSIEDAIRQYRLESKVTSPCWPAPASDKQAA